MTQLDAHLIAAVKHLESPQREYESWRIIFQAFHQQKAFFTRLDSLIVTKWYARAKEFLVQQFLQHLYRQEWFFPNKEKGPVLSVPK